MLERSAETKEQRRKRVIKEFLSLWEWGDPTFYEIIVKACKLHELKNRGYAGKRNPLANFYECEDFGVPAWKGCIVRMSDKWSRMKTLIKERNDPTLIAAKEMESLEDTIFDLGIYSFIELVLLKKVKSKRVYKKVFEQEKDSKEEAMIGTTC